MRLTNFFLLFITTILFTLACVADNPSESIPIALPTEIRTVTPHPTRTAIPTPLPVYPLATPIPAWVTDFADPILEAVIDRKPDFHDDFSLYRGWLNRISGTDGFIHAERYDGMLFLRLPERTKDSFVYNPKMNRRNFVLTLDLRFNHSQPDDTIRFQFDQSTDQSVSFDFSNNGNWRYQWGFQNNPQSVSGIYEHFPPEHVPVTIIMLGAQCAVYLNNDPLAYSSTCRAEPISRSEIWAASFRLLRNTDHAVTVNFDNLKLWDLDKLPALP